MAKPGDYDNCDKALKVRELKVKIVTFPASWRRYDLKRNAVLPKSQHTLFHHGGHLAVVQFFCNASGGQVCFGKGRSIKKIVDNGKVEMTSSVVGKHQISILQRS